ncbi:hypothetical protein F4604DRAFT_1931207 [Suillus subluteus]|nr:hypothetical protein F4604DRAFT_1931207 [Suillus subluteus]
MSTVAFIAEKEKMEQLQLEESWQSKIPARFSCGPLLASRLPAMVVKLEFEQLFLVHPLAFDLMEIE